MVRRLRILALLLGALALGVLVAVVVLDPLGQRRAALTRRVEALQARVEERDPTRPVLHGEATPGNAWVFYELALTPLERVSGRSEQFDVSGPFMLLDTLTLGGDAESRAQRREWLEDHAESLENLRRGARVSTSSRPFDWDDAWADQGPDGWAVSLMGHLSVASGLAAVGEGRSEEGVRDLLDGWQLGRDLAACPILTASSMGRLLVPGDMFPAHLAREGLAGMDGAALDLLEAGLTTLESSWPVDLPFLEGEGLFIGRIYLHSRDLGPLPGPTWRVGPLRTLSVLDAAETHLDLLDEARAALETPGANVDAIFEQRARTAEASYNPYLTLGVQLRPYARLVADTTLRIRALRALIASARGRDASALLDLDGRAITLENEDGELRARFAIHDGTDEVLTLRVDR